MNLSTWIDKQLAKEKTEGRSATRRSVLQTLATVADVSLATLSPLDRGARMTHYEKALAVSRATGYAVSVIELCDPEPAVTLSEIIRQAESERSDG